MPLKLCYALYALLFTAISYAQTTSYTFPFTSDSSVSDGIHIHASIGGGTSQEFLIDTGSLGILIGSNALGPDYTSTGQHFCFAYSSSNNTYRGEWVLANVTLSSGAVQATTQLMPIRVATEACSGATGKCTMNSTQIHVTMMGVGFDRGNTTANATDSCGNPELQGLNAFLQLSEMASGAMVPGYILSPSTETITLGITAENSAGFELVSLAPLANASANGGYPDWVAPHVEISVPGANFSASNASLLVDTGLAYSIVQAPAGDDLPGTTVKGATTVANGTAFDLTLPGLDHAMYTFETGQAGAPPYVSWRHFTGTTGPFINTGRWALSQFDYLYNAGAGQLGFSFT